MPGQDSALCSFSFSNPFLAGLFTTKEQQRQQQQIIYLWELSKNDRMSPFTTVGHLTTRGKLCISRASLVAQIVKKSTCNEGDLGSIPGLGGSSGEGNGYPLQYSGLENSMDRGAWQVQPIGLQRGGHDWATFTFLCVSVWKNNQDTVKWKKQVAD